MSTTNRWKYVFEIASGFSITYAALVGISILLIGVPRDMGLLVTTGFLVFLIYGIMGFFAEQETHHFWGYRKLEQRIDSAMAYICVAPPLFFIIGSIPNGIDYTWQSLNTLGVFICLALVIWNSFQNSTDVRLS